jgi:hypothetical protein
MSFFRVWWLGITNPRVAFDELGRKPAPAWGFWAIAVRFVVTSLTSILALYVLDRTPFVASYLTFLPTDSTYYLAEVFFLPVFGLGGWVLGGGVVHVILRLAGRESDFDWVLNVVGWSLLTVMPAVWMLDWVSLGLGVYGEGATPLIHALISVWEVALMGIGLSKMEGVKFWAACVLGLIVKGGVYIPLAMVFVR